MNLIVLVVVRKLLHIKTPFYKLELASAVGGFGACILVVAQIIKVAVVLQFLFIYVIISMLMILIAFPYHNVRTLCVQTVELYIVAFFISGLLSFLYYGTNLNAFLSEQIGGTLFQHRGMILLIQGIVVLIIASPVLSYIWKRIVSDAKLLYTIELKLGGRTIQGTGLLDTGNQLKDPIQGEPVCLCEWEWVKKLFTMDQKVCIENYKQLDLQKEVTIPIFPILFHSVGKEHGMLMGIKVDELVIHIHHKKITKYKSMIALYEGALTNDRRYQIILHQEIVEE